MEGDPVGEQDTVTETSNQQINNIISFKKEQICNNLTSMRTLDDQIHSALICISQEKGEGVVKIEKFCEEYNLKDILSALSKNLTSQKDIVSFFE